MSDFNEPAYPIEAKTVIDEYGQRRFSGYTGLTIRQQAALMAMQGILANPAFDLDAPSDVAFDAVAYADMVLKREAETR
jgi:hypothetical protein